MLGHLLPKAHQLSQQQPSEGQVRKELQQAVERGRELEFKRKSFLQQRC